MMTPNVAHPDSVSYARARHTSRQARTRPVLLLLECLLAIGLVSLFYLSQMAAVDTAGTQLRAQQATQSALSRQDALLHVQLGTVRSPAYIDQHARSLGYVPAPATPLQ